MTDEKPNYCRGQRVPDALNLRLQEADMALTAERQGRAELEAHAAGPWCADWSEAPKADVLVWDVDKDFWVLEYANGYYYDGTCRRTRERLQSHGVQWARLNPPKEDEL